MKYLTIAEVAELKGTSPRNIRQHVTSGNLKAEKKGGTYLISEDEANSFKPRPRGRKPNNGTNN